MRRLLLTGLMIHAAASFAGIEGAVNANYQNATDNSAEDEWLASADLFLTRSLGGGDLMLHIEGSTSTNDSGVSSRYPVANGDAGSVTDAAGGGSVQVSELSYTMAISKEDTFTIGLIDPSAWMDESIVANDENTAFINGQFVNNATIEFPDYTIGGTVRLSGDHTELTLIATGATGISDRADRSYRALHSDSLEHGVFLASQVAVDRGPATFRLGGWLRTDDHPVAGDPAASQSNYGAYVVADWALGDHHVNARLGLARASVAETDRFVAISYQRGTRWGQFGAAVARTSPGSFLQASLEDTTNVEMYLRIPVADQFQLTPSVQYIEHPGAFDGMSVTPGSSSIVVGVRAVMTTL